MNATLRNSLAILALAAAVPANASTTTWVDWEWYADVGTPFQVTTIQSNSYPASRRGFIWAPAHYEWDGGTRQIFLPGAWIVDDYETQWRYYAFGNTVVVASGPFVLPDRDGNVIPTSPASYPVSSAR
jgi:hypothetical protein